MHYAWKRGGVRRGRHHLLIGFLKHKKYPTGISNTYSFSKISSRKGCLGMVHKHNPCIQTTSSAVIALGMLEGTYLHIPFHICLNLPVVHFIEKQKRWIEGTSGGHLDNLLLRAQMLLKLDQVSSDCLTSSGKPPRMEISQPPFLLFQCCATLSVNKIFLISCLNLPRHSLCPFYFGLPCATTKKT